MRAWNRETGSMILTMCLMLAPRAVPLVHGPACNVAMLEVRLAWVRQKRCRAPKATHSSNGLIT
jgi:hypothetical protein